MEAANIVGGVSARGPEKTDLGSRTTNQAKDIPIESRIARLHRKAPTRHGYDVAWAGHKLTL
jgi:hypothetical protein